MKILLDPGHGGNQPGAVYGGVEEEDVTLAVGLRCAHLLRLLGHDALLTRDRDANVSLSERLIMINEYQAAAFCSIHCNASAAGGKAHGAETYYRDDQDWPLANCLQKVLTIYTGEKNVGIFQDIARLNKRLTVLNDEKIPSALVELGYLSNFADRTYLINNINTVGEVLAHGIDWFACLKDGRTKEVWPV
jgi:N-acetylmuramoyl-L-alanine amidase